MEAALHEHLGLPGPHQRHGLLGRLVAVRRVDEPVAPDVEAGVRGGAPDLVLGADQGRAAKPRAPGRHQMRKMPTSPGMPPG